MAQRVIEASIGDHQWFDRLLSAVGSTDSRQRPLGPTGYIDLDSISGRFQLWKDTVQRLRDRPAVLILGDQGMPNWCRHRLARNLASAEGFHVVLAPGCSDRTAELASRTWPKRSILDLREWRVPPGTFTPRLDEAMRQIVRGEERLEDRRRQQDSPEPGSMGPIEASTPSPEPPPDEPTVPKPAKPSRFQRAIEAITYSVIGGLILLFFTSVTSDRDPDPSPAPEPPTYPFVPIRGGTLPCANERDVPIEPFMLGEFEVSHDEFARFRERHESPWDGLQRDGRGVDFGKLPVVDVNLLDAKAFCRSLDARLPTRAEWLYVAHVTEAAVANDSVIDNAHFAADLPRPADEGVRCKVGTRNLIGNVAEWVDTVYPTFACAGTQGFMAPPLSGIYNTPYWVLGGSYRTSDDTARSYSTSELGGSRLAVEVVRDVGFRCARDIPPMLEPP